MKKLKLDLDTLAVESHATVATETATGTVAAYSDPVTDRILFEWTVVAVTYYMSTIC